MEQVSLVVLWSSRSWDSWQRSKVFMFLKWLNQVQLPKCIRQMSLRCSSYGKASLDWMTLYTEFLVYRWTFYYQIVACSKWSFTVAASWNYLVVSRCTNVQLLCCFDGGSTLPRSWPGVHCLSCCCDRDACCSTVVNSLFLHGDPAGTRQWGIRKKQKPGNRN